jgi:glyoxylase-like metal-dependent hydrolase (beta-lactamase superfamily II)
MLKVLKLPVELLGSNCYLAWDTENNEAVVIDPGGEADRIIQAVDKRKLNLRYILNTHGHGDHIAVNGKLKTRYGVPLLIHQADAPMLTDPNLNMSAVYGFPVASPEQDGFLVPGEKVAFGGLSLEIIATPGHSPGGVSFYSEGVVFSGDALFFGSIGRFDLPDGDGELLIRSIKENLLTLPEDTQVFPGHGQNTTIGMEKRSNPFLV